MLPYFLIVLALLGVLGVLRYRRQVRERADAWVHLRNLWDQAQSLKVEPTFTPEETRSFHGAPVKLHNLPCERDEPIDLATRRASQRQKPRTLQASTPTGDDMGLAHPLHPFNPAGVWATNYDSPSCSSSDSSSGSDSGSCGGSGD